MLTSGSEVAGWMVQCRCAKWTPDTAHGDRGAVHLRIRGSLPRN